MSALSLATLGVQCPGSRALSMSSLGVFCLVIGGGGRRGKRELYFDNFELHLDYDLDAQGVLPEEMLDLLGVPLLPPILPDAPALADIDEPIEREIAQLIRKQEVIDHGKLQQKRLELLQLLDMELYFMVLALLDEDF